MDDEKAEVMPDNEGAEGEAPAIIPEDFQKSVHEFLSSCTSDECLDYIADAVAKKRTASAKANDFDVEGMPGE